VKEGKLRARSRTSSHRLRDLLSLLLRDSLNIGDPRRRLRDSLVGELREGREGAGPESDQLRAHQLNFACLRLSV